MKLLISPSKLTGSVPVPPSKSVFQRLVACAVLSDAETTIFNPSFSKDGISALNIAVALGKEISSEEDKVHVSGKMNLNNPDISVGESGLALRMFTPIFSLFDKEISVSGEMSIAKRPIGVYQQLLPKHNVEVKTKEGLLPMTIKGPLKGGEFFIDASLSSQHITGLLIALPNCQEDSVLNLQNVTSTDYIRMTIEVLETFGIEIKATEDLTQIHISGNQVFKGNEIVTDGDWSAGAFLLIAGALIGANDYEVLGLDSLYSQADQAIAGLLLFAGCKIKNQLGDYKIIAHSIRAFEFDATDCPDLFPPLAALAVFADKASKIKGVHRLEHKESNRGEVIQKELAKAGIKSEISEDTLTVYPGIPKACVLHSHGDHRIAMMATLLGLAGTNEIQLEGAEAVDKSYPNFYSDLMELGANIRQVR